MKKAVVLLNLGGPASMSEVEPFLFSLFYDPAILSLPNPFRYVLAKVISKKRKKEAVAIYSLLGGGSPLLKNTQDQAHALERALGDGHRVFVSMRHAPPHSREAVERVREYGPEEVILLPLYPQYSTTTTASAIKDWCRFGRDLGLPIRFISEYPEEEGFIIAMKSLSEPMVAKAKEFGRPKILLTAHGLPEKIVKKGDPYQKQVEATAQKLALSLGVQGEDVVLCYQSRVGPLKWIGPYTDEQIVSASQERRPIVVVPISFVSEHSETLVELDIEYKNLATEEGCPAYFRVPTVQTNPAFIEGLAGLVLSGDKLVEAQGVS